MSPRLVSPLLRAAARHGRVMESLDHRPIGTNGYVSSWGALMSLCPPARG